jgi:predicted transcriptional regulator
MVRRKRVSGTLEADVLAILWASPTPLTTGQMMDALGTGLAYTTVQTILARLLAKGAVARQLVGRAHAYSPVLDQAGLAASRMHAMLDRGGDRAAVLSRFVGTLTAEEEVTLIALLREMTREAEGS